MTPHKQADAHSSVQKRLGNPRKPSLPAGDGLRAIGNSHVGDFPVLRSRPGTLSQCGHKQDRLLECARVRGSNAGNAGGLLGRDENGWVRAKCGTSYNRNLIVMRCLVGNTLE